MNGTKDKTKNKAKKLKKSPLLTWLAFLHSTLLLAPVLPWYVEDDWMHACEKCIELLLFDRAGHTLVIHSRDAEVIRQFALKKPVARLLVNTPANMRVWVDGVRRFGREGGAMIPAFHRAPLNQMADLSLAKGLHTLRIGLAPADEAMRQAELLFGIADENNQWIPGMFRRNPGSPV